MKKSLKKTTEIALIYAMTNFTETPLKGRLEGMANRLRELTYKEIEKLPHFDNDELAQAEKVLKQFEVESGWKGKGRHIATLASFGLDIIEHSEFTFDPKIQETLINIVDHFDRAGNVPSPCFWSGAVAAEKWVKIMETV